MGTVLLTLGAFALALAWQLPGHYIPWPTFQQELVASLGALLIGAAALARRRTAVQWPVLALVALAAAAIPFIQLAAGQIYYVTDAALAAAYLAGFGACVAIGATLARENRDEFLDALTLAFIFGAIASTGLALAQWLGATDSVMVEMTESNRPFANLSQPNNLATLLWLGVCGTLRLRFHRRIGVVPTAIALAFMGGGLVLCQSRTAWLFSIALAAWLLWNRRKAGLRLSPLAVCAALSLFAAAVLMLPLASETLLLGQDETIAQRATGGSATRLIYWHMFLDAVRESPLWGYGWVQTNLAQQSVLLNQPYTGHNVTYSHNLFIDLLVWNGVPIGALLIAALIWWSIRQLKRCRSIDQVTLIAALAAFALHALLEFPFAYTYFLLPIALVIGALDGLDDSAPALQTRKYSLAAPLALLLCFTGIVAIEYPKLEHQTRSVRFALAGYKVKGDEPEKLSAAGTLLLDRQLELNRFVLLNAERRVTTEEFERSWRVVQRMPMAPLQMHIAILAGLNGRHAEAAKALALLCRMGPPENCATARLAWVRLQSKHAVLKGVPPPEMPPGHQTQDL